MTKREDSLACALHDLRERYLPCPDHRDKHRTGDECLACQRDRYKEKMEKLLESVRLLDLVVAEFRSDPMSVQCFDLRVIVRPARDLVEQLQRDGVVDEAWKNYNDERASGGRRSG